MWVSASAATVQAMGQAPRPSEDLVPRVEALVPTVRVGLTASSDRLTGRPFVALTRTDRVKQTIHDGFGEGGPGESGSLLTR